MWTEYNQDHGAPYKPEDKVKVLEEALVDSQLELLKAEQRIDILLQLLKGRQEPIQLELPYTVT